MNLYDALFESASLNEATLKNIIYLINNMKKPDTTTSKKQFIRLFDDAVQTNKFDEEEKNIIKNQLRSLVSINKLTNTDFNILMRSLNQGENTFKVNTQGENKKKLEKDKELDKRAYRQNIYNLRKQGKLGRRPY